MTQAKETNRRRLDLGPGLPPGSESGSTGAKTCGFCRVSKLVQQGRVNLPSGCKEMVRAPLKGNLVQQEWRHPKTIQASKIQNKSMLQVPLLTKRSKIVIKNCCTTRQKILQCRSPWASQRKGAHPWVIASVLLGQSVRAPTPNG